MRGHDRPQATMLTLVNPGQRVPANHPIRLIKALAEVALKELSPLFEQMYSDVGRPSIPPERLLKASLLMALYTVRSERMFCEQLDYNLLFRWFLDLNWDEPGFDHSSFSRNRARLLGNPSVNFHGERRQNATHQSTTDPEARLAKRAPERGQALLHRERADGESQRDNDRSASGSGHWSGRMRARASDASTTARVEPDHSCRRQGLRCRRVRGRLSRSQRHSTRGAE